MRLGAALPITTEDGGPPGAREFADGAAMLERLGQGAERFFMWTPGIAVPDGAEGRGLYVDAVYF